MINVTDRQTHTLHHTHSKVRIKRYTQTHIILLVISIIIAIMPRMTRRWTFCWHKRGVSAAALDRTHNFEVQENHNGCWNTPNTLIVINNIEGYNDNSECKKYRQIHLHQIGCTTDDMCHPPIFIHPSHWWWRSSIILLIVAPKGCGQIKFVRLKKEMTLVWALYHISPRHVVEDDTISKWFQEMVTAETYLDGEHQT